MPNTYNPAADPFQGYARSPEAVAFDAVPVTPADGANLAAYAKALRIFVPAATASATLRVTPLHAADDANTVTLSFPSGVHYEPLCVRRVWATGTSAGIEIHAFTV
ncbi:MAG: hypothetical protein LCH38_03300 [Proteobacteria bacterium]|nr:hypothetical protein [Pseudomonadota bacterium]